MKDDEKEFMTKFFLIIVFITDILLCQCFQMLHSFPLWLVLIPGLYCHWGPELHQSHKIQTACFSANTYWTQSNSGSQIKKRFPCMISSQENWSIVLVILFIIGEKNLCHKLLNNPNCQLPTRTFFCSPNIPALFLLF